MSRKCFKQVCVLLVLGIVFCGVTTSANATYLTNDGGFAAQTLTYGTWGSVGGSWTGGGACWVGNTDEASPFTNVFSGNSIGAGFNGGDGPYIAQTSATNTPSTAAGYLYLNFDFKNITDSAGTYGVFAADGASYATRTLGLYISSSTLYAESSAGIDALPLSLLPNTWYNVQLALNLNTDFYSGAITAFGGGATPISSRPFIHDTSINTIFTDSASYLYPGLAASPAHRIDNFVLSTTPFPTPEPGTLALLITGLIGLLCYAWRKRR